jgi:hypothetical protein
MESLFHFALALLFAGAPWLAAIIVVAVALAIIGPVKLNLAIGDHSGRRRRRAQTCLHFMRSLRPSFLTHARLWKHGAAVVGQNLSFMGRGSGAKHERL